ncbi:MAG: CFI-box-CTERM domain-containing protein [Candidatus Nitrosotenuis sp.]
METIPIAEAHDVQAQLQSRFVKIEDETFNTQTLQTGQSLVINGIFVSSVNRDLRAWHSIFYESSDGGKLQVLERNPPGNVFDIPPNGIVHYNMTVKALSAGTYHVHTQLNIESVGPGLGPGQTVVVTEDISDKQVFSTKIDVDEDGILNSSDSCVDEPEKYNNYLDTDGCPDDLPQKPHVNDWSLVDIEGAKLNLENNDGTIVLPENLDAYFSTISDVYEKIQGKIPETRYGIQSSAYYDGKDFTMTKTLTVNILTNDEYVDIFGDKSTPLSNPIQIKDVTIDENFIQEKIQSERLRCDQSGKSLAFCNVSSDDLKKAVLEKTGIHSITETMTIKKISSNSEITTIDIKNLSSVRRTDYIGTKPFLKSVLLEKTHDNLLPKALAQENSGVHKELFLNGFTLGYGFEKHWDYEFNVLDMVPIKIDAYAEVGLGVGLRVPIQAELQIDPPTYVPGSGNDSFNIYYTVTTLNLDEEDYSEILPLGQEFGGNEFKMYLGPRVAVDMTLFDDVEINLEKGLVDKLEDGDFTPPLDNSETRQPITSFTVPCEVTDTCIEVPGITFGLFSGAHMDMTGKKVTINSNPLQSIDGGHTLTFTHRGQPQLHKYRIADDILVEDIPLIFEAHLKDVKYYSDLYLVPSIKFAAELDSWVFPLSIGSGWINLPEIQFSNVEFAKHDGTIDIPERETEHGPISESPPPAPTGPNCGPGTHAEGNTCVPDKGPVQCAIATAAFGTELAPQVQLLREVRDNVLFSTGAGTSFMAGFNEFYYAFSPTVADWERQSPLFKEVVKTTITPMLSTMSILNYVDINSEQEMLGYGIGVILLNIGMYFVAPAIVIVKVKGLLQKRRL